jgi:hypothetical protein
MHGKGVVNKQLHISSNRHTWHLQVPELLQLSPHTRDAALQTTCTSPLSITQQLVLNAKVTVFAKAKLLISAINPMALMVQRGAHKVWVTDL